MNRLFTSDRSIRRLRNVRVFFIFVAILGLIILALQDFSKVSGFGNLAHSLQGLPLMLFGIIMVFITSKQSKRIAGVFIRFTDETIEYKTENESLIFHIKTEIAKLNCISDSIEIVDKSGETSIFSLKDRFKSDERKAIKAICEEISNNMQ